MPLFTLGGAVARVPEDATAFPNRHAQHNLNIVGAWEINDPDPKRHIAWVRQTWEAMQPFASGAYVNFMMEEGDDRIKATYGDNYERLVQVKTKYDPKNVFRVNQNIKPAARRHQGL